MLSPTIATWRLSLHVLAAAVWVGGQFAFAAASAAVHQVSRSRAALAIGGAVGAIAAFAALFLGVLLHSGT